MVQVEGEETESERAPVPVTGTRAIEDTCGATTASEAAAAREAWFTWVTVSIRSATGRYVAVERDSLGLSRRRSRVGNCEPAG